MKQTRRMMASGVIGILIATSLLLLPAEPALARPHFSFWLNFGVPVAPYPAYTYPGPVHYVPAPVYGVYPPCARVWVPGCNDAYGNWVFGYYRYDCNTYGY